MVVGDEEVWWVRGHGGLDGEENESKWRGGYGTQRGRAQVQW